jgi:hypothetical protein
MTNANMFETVEVVFSSHNMSSATLGSQRFHLTSLRVRAVLSTGVVDAVVATSPPIDQTTAIPEAPLSITVEGHPESSISMVYSQPPQDSEHHPKHPGLIPASDQDRAKLIQMIQSAVVRLT